jgi:hypothetical protein
MNCITMLTMQVLHAVESRLRTRHADELQKCGVHVVEYIWRLTKN